MNNCVNLHEVDDDDDENNDHNSDTDSDHDPLPVLTLLFSSGDGGWLTSCGWG